MPDYGKVSQLPSRKSPVIDFYPDLKGKQRRLWSFMGTGFSSIEEAEVVRSRICSRAMEVGLAEAVNQFRSMRTKADLVSKVVEQFLKDAPSLGSLHNSGEPYSKRTLDHYKNILNRAQPYFEGMTMRQFMDTKELLRFKAWFKLPKRPDDVPPDPGEYGRGLKTDTEMSNCFAALRAVVRYYRVKNSEFTVVWPSNPTKETIAKKARKERRSRSGKREASLILQQVVQTIEAIDENRQPIFWTLFFTQSRICEARGVLGQDYLFEAEEDWERGRLFIERSADSKGAEAQIRNSTKTGVDGSYLMPEFIQKLIAKHCSHARFDPSLPLFRNPHPLAKSDIWTDDALANTWRAALDSNELPWVPLYKSMKHTQISALRDAGLPVDDILEQCRWTSPEMMARYDRESDRRRDKVGSMLAELVDKAKR